MQHLLENYRKIDVVDTCTSALRRASTKPKHFQDLDDSVAPQEWPGNSTFRYSVLVD